MPNAVINSVGSYVPDYVLTNEEMETMMDTSNEWIMTRSGIRERRILKGKGLGSSFMAEKAARVALEKRGLDPSDLDLIIVATVTLDHPYPFTANIVADKIGAVNAWSYDLQAACSNFLYALNTASNFIRSGEHKNVLVIGSDKMSSIVDYSDRSTSILFGDAAGAVLLEASDEPYGVMDGRMYVDGSGMKFLHQKAGGSVHPSSLETVMNKMHFVSMEGQSVFKVAVVKMADVAEEMMVRNNLKAEDIDYLVPHQANLRIIEAAAERMGVGMDKVMVNIDRYGNTTSATIPLCLSEWESKLKKGDNLILTTFGAGFTWGGIYLKWGY